MNAPLNSAQGNWFDAVRCGDISLVSELITTYAGTRTETGETALMIACRMNNANLASILIPSEIDACTDAHEDALIFAAQSGACKTLALLLAYTSIRRTKAGITALDIAVQREDAPSLRILLRHPGLTLEDLQCTYDRMIPTTSEPIQQLILHELSIRGVHCEIKKQPLKPENLATNQETYAAEPNRSHDLELSLTPNISIWDASTVEQRSCRSTTRLDPTSACQLSGIEEDTCSMSFLKSAQLITSESSSNISGYETTIHESQRPHCLDKLIVPESQQANPALLGNIRDSAIHNKNEYVQTVYPIFTEAQMAEKNDNIEVLRTEVAARQRELEAQQRQNEEQASIFVSKIETLEIKVAEITKAHGVEMEALQKENASLRAINASLGEEIAVLCQSASFENLSTLLAAAQQLVKSELPSIHITERADSITTNRNSSVHSRQSDADSMEVLLEHNKLHEADVVSQKCVQQAQLISSLQANIMQRDEQIKLLTRQNEELKKTIQSHENSISLCNTTVDKLIQSPHVLSTGMLLQDAPQNTLGTVASKPKSSTPIRRSIASPRSENSALSRSRRSKVSPGTPQISKAIERTHTLTTPTRSIAHTSTRLKSSSIKPPTTQSLKMQPSPALRSTRRMLDTTPDHQREDTRSPLDEWMLIASKNRAFSKRWSTHTPLMDAVLFRHNHDIPRHMEYVGCALNNGYTALMFACERDNKGAVSILAPLECGMCLDNGDTALILALRSEHFETAELLRGLESGYCDVQNIKQMHTNNMESSTSRKGLCTEMMKYAIEGDVLRIFCLLPHQSREKDEDGNTSLIHAVSNNNLSAVKLLCTTEAGLHNKKGETALIRAAKNGNVECCLLLIDYEKRRQDGKGYTALMWAAVAGDVTMVRLLTPYEAGVQNAQDDNCTALMYAVEFQNFDCAEILVPREKSLEDTRGLSALERLKKYSGSINPQLRDAFARLLS
ncbi:Protein 21.1 [Giardia lamblia P15]|uniref:Protein 21.1 n=1 Tax=Giardia intestinalis (strain P15) TaxID=658858 RepID=E1F1W2_GIAIA|nr:Protein 21.1 [Giardia lamblia P15]